MYKHLKPGALLGIGVGKEIKGYILFIEVKKTKRKGDWSRFKGIREYEYTFLSSTGKIIKSIFPEWERLNQIFPKGNKIFWLEEQNNA